MTGFESGDRRIDINVQIGAPAPRVDHERKERADELGAKRKIRRKIEAVRLHTRRGPLRGKAHPELCVRA